MSARRSISICPERKIVLTPDNTVDRVMTPERLDAHRLIEEFMILANVAAAETLERAHVPLIYRVHDEPDMEKVKALREFLQDARHLAAEGRALRAGQFNHILRGSKATRPRSWSTKWCCARRRRPNTPPRTTAISGSTCAATRISPRRSAATPTSSCIAALIRARKLGDGGLPETEDVRTLGEIAARISAAERRAMKAERETFDRLLAHFLADRVGATFEGRIAGVTRAGLFVKLDDTGADGFIPARTIGDRIFPLSRGRATR